MEVFLSEDGTAIKPVFQYDRRTNQCVGPVLPLINGCPVVDSYPATSAATMANYFVNRALSKIAYVVMVQPLAARAPAFCLVMFGTDNKFSAEDVGHRLDYMERGLRNEGIVVVGWAADGDNRCLKVMRAQLFPSIPIIPKEFSKEWFFATISFKGPTPNQDGVHVLNRYKTRMIKASVILQMGKRTVSVSHVRAVIRHTSKMEHGLTEYDLDMRDKMNFNATEKLCSERTTKVMQEKVPSCEATLLYLELMRKIKDACLNPSLTALERVYNMWYVVCVLRKWKSWIQSSKKYTVKDNFITQNMYVVQKLLPMQLSL